MDGHHFVEAYAAPKVQPAISPGQRPGNRLPKQFSALQGRYGAVPALECLVLASQY